ncbi:hypothetical protein DLM45_13210 [Hyphomicrobium methylovorum]|uniref:hypothetical protein n=1 Tax=Hyphomicrobium methylovorum TaxID=84 RepID=UPI0015E76EAE|nr:hypothetical protein [Hyphomicrobium methylovorum]MBA2127172.1 hypothetical protein [Hyphomicrobium methylovorum]
MEIKTVTAALITAFDALDEANDERIGGPEAVADDVLRSLEDHILASHADTPDALAWKVRWLARAVANDWSEPDVRTIARSIESDLAMSMT